MADLDDFFAKKDKKKSKGARAGAAGGRFSTAEQVARRLEAAAEAAPPARPRPKKDKSDEPAGAAEEDEWREFEEQKKDYSGLRIQNMQLSETADAGGGGADYDDADDEESGRRAAPGPWKKAAAASAAAADSDEEDDEPPPPPPPAASATAGGGGGAPSAYVPPHLRNASSAPSAPQSSGGRSGRGRLAPDINNEAYFPTLSAASTSEPAGAWGKKGRREESGFEDVRNSKSHSSRMETGGGGGGPRGTGSGVAMENKFAALRGAADQS